MRNTKFLKNILVSASRYIITLSLNYSINDLLVAITPILHTLQRQPWGTAFTEEPPGFCWCEAPMRMGGTLRAGIGAGTFSGPVGTCRVAMAYTLCTLEYWKSLSLSSNSIMLVALSLILNHYLDIVEST